MDDNQLVQDGRVDLDGALSRVMTGQQVGLSDRTWFHIDPSEGGAVLTQDGCRVVLDLHEFAALTVLIQGLEAVADGLPEPGQHDIDTPVSGV